MAVEKQEIETYFGKCKCCLNYGYLRTMWEEHVEDNRAEVYGQMLTQCFSISWTIQGREDDDQICEDCVWKLREAYTFKEQVVKNQNQLNHEEVLVEEIKQEADDDYVVEYLDEDILEKQNADYEDSDDESRDFEDKESQDEDDISFKDDEEDEDYDENQNPEDDDDDFIPDKPAPRKRKARKPKNADDSDSDEENPKPKWPKKLPAEDRLKTYKQYPEENLKAAVDAVMAKTMNQRSAAKQFRIPRKTLSAKVRAVKNNGVNENPLTPISDEEEEKPDMASVMLTIKKHRENIHSVLAYSNATPIRNFYGEGYVCAFCPDQFSVASDLKTHYQKHGNLSKLYVVHHVRSHVTRLDVTGLKCTICDNKIEDLKSLLFHLKHEHKKPMHFDINNHMIPFKFDTKQLECVDCGKQFNLFKNLSEHMANMHYRNYVCKRCNRGFVNKVNMVAHKDIHRTGEFACDYCGKTYDTRRKKTSHERNTHTLQNKSVKCEYCKMRFVNNSQKKNHELRRHMMQRLRFPCNACDKTFARSRSLRHHVQREHLLNRPYKCSIEGCDKSFYLRKTLEGHENSHYEKKEKNFPCTLCTKVYKSEKGLKDHMYLHNKKPFECPECSKSYMVQDTLKRHLREKH